MHQERPPFPFYVRLALTLLSVVLVLFLLSVGKTVFIPLFFALLVSILLYPIASWLERRKMPRSISSLIALLVFMAGIAGFIYFFTFQAINFFEDIPALRVKVEHTFASLQLWVTQKYHVNNAQQLGYLGKSANGLLTTAANSISSLFVDVLNVLIWNIFVLIYTYFILFHRGLLMRFVLSLFTPAHRAKTADIVTETRKVINSYVRGLLVEMIVVALLTSIVFLVLGIKYAILLGVLTALLNIIPYLGVYTGMAFSVLVTLANGSVSDIAGICISMLIIHFLDANILMPKIVGGSVKMNPFITIVAVLTGHLIWGIPGMFLFIPITAIVKIICDRVDGLKAWAILIGTEEKEPVK